MKKAFKVIATLLIVVAFALECAVIVAIKSSSHSVNMADKDDTILRIFLLSLFASVFLILLMWNPWKKK